MPFIARPAVDHDRKRVLTAMIMPAAAVALMWIVLAFDEVFQLHLARFGIYPRSVHGLKGIFFAPFIHGSVEHLFNNSVPILVLGWFTVYFYPKASGRLVLVSWITTGLWVWVMGRSSYHIGASGIVYALAGFIFFSGVIRRRIQLIAVSLIVVFLYGSMWWGALPLQPAVSWESHLAGGIVGSLMAWFYRKLPTAHVAPPRVYEEEEDEDDGPQSGDDPGDEHVPPPANPQRPMYHPSNTSSTWP